LALAATVVILGIVSAYRGPAPGAQGSPLESIPFAAAVAACWYSFMGWQDAALLTEEMRHPARDVRFVLVATVGVVSAVYLAVHLALYAGLGRDDARGAFPALALAHRFLGARGETAMSVALLVSMVGGAAESLLVRPRILYALSRDGFAPRALTFVNRGGTPAAAMLLHAALVLGLVMTGSFRSLLALVAFTQALTGLAESASALALFDARSRRASGPLMRWALVAANAALCVLVAWQDPWQVAYAAAVLALLAAVYPFLRGRMRAARQDAGSAG